MMPRFKVNRGTRIHAGGRKQHPETKAVLETLISGGVVALDTTTRAIQVSNAARNQLRKDGFGSDLVTVCQRRRLVWCQKAEAVA
jgi:hypothetical protein